MLMTLGPIQFDVHPFNAFGYDHDHGTDFAEKSVLGVRPPLEFVGEGTESWTIQAKLFPRKFGGLSSLTKLQQARTSGKPQYLMRGDGRPMGWVVIERVRERSQYLDPGGVGQIIDVDITVKRSGSPSAGSYFSIMQGLLP